MIHPFDTKQLFVILYIGITLICIVYYIIKFDDFQPMYILLGVVWPIVLWCGFLILIFTYNGERHDRKKFRDIKNKPDFFKTYKGQVHPKLKSDVERYRKKTAKRALRRNAKSP